MTDELKASWVDTQAQVDELSARLRQASTVALDTEFHGERSYTPHLMLIQLATDDGLWLVDPRADVDLRGLFETLADGGPQVVGHALHNDLEILALRYDIVMKRVFDTQIAASFLGYGLQIGLVNLINELFSVRLPKGAQMADWSQRPLPERQRVYAANDVRYLLGAQALLTEELERNDRLSWVNEECQQLSSSERYGRDPDLVYRRVSGFRKLRAIEAGVLVALAAERERIAAHLDLVPHFLLSDDTLVALARRKPTEFADVKGDRRLNHRNIHKFQERWLAAVQRGLQKPFPRPPSRPQITPGMEAAAAVVMLVVNELAERERLAPQLLLRRKEMIRVLQDGFDSQEQMLDLLALKGWRRRLLGDVVWDLLQGRLQITCGHHPKRGYHVDFNQIDGTAD
ncbi:MAG TPA: hypothetical protein DCQ06_00905 [Myxococcales bacterium]|nr:hypothetical protein [Myxococcales bacterium]HAN30131.1 hypothetical protein [Myxococcales bacterium]